MIVRPTAHGRLSLRLLLLLLLSFLSASWVGLAHGSFPAQPTWIAENASGNCIFEGSPVRCMVRDTQGEIFQAIDAAVSSTCGWLGDWFQSSGTYPNEVWEHVANFGSASNPPGDCSPPAGPNPFFALQTTPLKCPEHSTLANGQCTCDEPLLEVANACSGGGNNGSGDGPPPPPPGPPGSPPPGSPPGSPPPGSPPGSPPPGSPPGSPPPSSSPGSPPPPSGRP